MRSILDFFFVILIIFLPILVQTTSVNDTNVATESDLKRTLETTTSENGHTATVPDELIQRIFNVKIEPNSIFINQKKENEDIFKVERAPDGQLTVVINNTRIIPTRDEQSNISQNANLVTPPPVRGNQDVIFPDDSKFFPFVNGKPHCAKNDDVFCTYIENYPADHVETILQTEARKFEPLFGDDLVLNTINLTQRIDAPGEESLCTSSERLIYPQAGLTKDNNWSFIVNQQNYTQGIRIEECISTGKPCFMTESFPNGYTTECKQKYIYRQLVSFNQDGRIVKDLFKFPSCCKCIVKSSHRFRRQSPVRRKN